MSHLSLTEVVLVSISALFTSILGSWYLSRRRRFRISTPLRGPKRLHPIWGWNQVIIKTGNIEELYEGWVKEFGSIVGVPTVLWNQKIVLTDPKAITHFYANDPDIYEQNGLIKNIFIASGRQHKRLRKALTPAFSIVCIIQPLYDTCNLIDVNSIIRLDSIDIAGFGHHSIPSVTNRLLSWRYLNMLMRKFRTTMSDCAQDLLLHTKQETKALGEHSVADKSVIGLLVKAESANGSLGMIKEEVMSQMNGLLLAGYETTSVSFTWALVELAKSKTIQSQLREELEQFKNDPSYDQLMSTSALPILDGVVHEILRLHPPLPQSNRIANKDDILPLSHPYITSDGTVVDRITIAKGSTVSVPIDMISRSKEFWGEDANDFNPSRWLPTSTPSVEVSEFMGHRHLLTFSDGPRMCLGKNFALAEVKATLFVLIKHFSFEFENGVVGTKIEVHRGLLKRPKVEGRDGPEMPMRVRRV
ncbi:cytochrome P450 [Flagelloscypha sp. PMI_526]|nr:cytochrome P450 [Flagelloscypha sp. PMI_526]